MSLNNSKNKMSNNSIKNLFSRNKENMENKSHNIENTLVELKLDNINNDINNINKIKVKMMMLMTYIKKRVN